MNRRRIRLDILSIFGSKVFNDAVMRQRLPKRVYDSLKHTNREGAPLDPAIADVVAGAMKDWAIANGATHYTHWFQPMTNVTAGKHDSFLASPMGGCATPLRRAATPPGTRPPPPLSATTPSTSPPRSAPIRAKRWI